MYGLDDFQFFYKGILQQAAEIDISIQSTLIEPRRDSQRLFNRPRVLCQVSFGLNQGSIGIRFGQFDVLGSRSLRQLFAILQQSQQKAFHSFRRVGQQLLLRIALRKAARKVGEFRPQAIIINMNNCGIYNDSFMFDDVRKDTIVYIYSFLEFINPL